MIPSCRGCRGNPDTGFDGERDHRPVEKLSTVARVNSCDTHILLKAVIAELGLLLRKCKPSDGRAVVVLGGEGAERTPAAPNVEQAVIRSKIELQRTFSSAPPVHRDSNSESHLFADDRQLVIL